MVQFKLTLGTAAEIIPKPCSLILVLSSISKVEREGNTAVLMEHLSLIT